MADYWWEVRVDCSREAGEAVAFLLGQAGSAGVAEQPSPSDELRVCGYVRRLDAAGVADLALAVSQLGRYGLRPGAGRVAVRRVPDSDWAHGWKAHFHAVRIGKRLVVKPSWERYDSAPGEVVVTLDPGMAFGTGTHPTTALCLRSLLDLVKSGMRVADIGTGSGILAIAAARLGATVTAVDVDRDAVATARRNARLNGTTARVCVLHGSIEALNGFHPFDLVVSNLTADPVIDLCRPLMRHLSRDGHWIASGIIGTRVECVRRAMVDAAWRIEAVWEDGEWAAIHARPAAEREGGTA